MTHSAHHALIQCNATDADELPVRWQLTCRGTSWHGHVGNCTGLASRLAAAAQESETRDALLIAPVIVDLDYRALLISSMDYFIGIVGFYCTTIQSPIYYEL